MIDRVLEIRAGEYCKALKNVSGNEEIFSGHFPHHAMMPAVMIIECFAQTAGCVMNSRIEEPLEFVFFAGINNAKLAGHSMRSGIATVLAKEGATENDIKKITGHRSSQMVQRYIQDSEIFDNATKLLDL